MSNAQAQIISGHLPPQAPELESAVLGAVMLEREKLSEAIAIIKSADCFYLDKHQKIFEAILHLYIKGSPVDLLTVTEELRRRGQLEAIGGAYYLTQLTMSVVSSAHVEAHARIVVEKHMARQLIQIGVRFVASAYKDEEDIFDLLEQAEIAIANITDRIRSSNIKRLGSLLSGIIGDMKEAQHRPDGMVGVRTGFKKLDEQTRGLLPGNKITLAAGTREGKTTFALNLAMNVAQNVGPVGFFSLEMKDRELIWKMISAEIQEDVNSVMSGNFSLDKWKVLESRIYQKLYDLNFYLYDEGGLNIVELKAVARGMVLKHGAQLIVIDYEQLVRGVPGKKYGTREEEVNDVSKQIKGLAMELNVPIISLSQLNRMEKGGTKRMYVLSDLRESGALEHDANSVWFIFRPWIHKIQDFEGIYCTELDGWIYIAKTRLGKEGMIRLRFDGPFNKFSDYVDTPADVFGDSGMKAFSAGLAHAARTVIDYSQPLSAQAAEDTPF